MSGEKNGVSRRDREKADHRDEILVAAEEIFADQGYSATKMEEIAERSNFAVGTLYRHFKNKEVLYAELLRERVDDLEPLVYDALWLDGSPLEKLRRYFFARIDTFWHHPHLFRLYYHQSMGTVPNIRAGFTSDIGERYDALMETICIFIQAGIAEGEILDIDPAVIARALEGMIHSHTSYLSRQEDPSRNRDEEEALIDVLLNGILLNETIPENGS